MARMRRQLRSVALVAALCCVGCPKEREPKRTRRHVGPEPSLPLPAGSPGSPRLSASQRVPAWAAELPAVAPGFAAEQDVWATPPQADTAIARTAIFSVEGVYDGLASLIDRQGQRVDGVPAALVHPATSRRNVEEGEVVLCYARKLPVALARVAEVRAGSEIEVLYDYDGTTKTVTIEHAETPVSGIAPMAFVGFDKAGALSRGLVVALSEDKGWLRTESGKVEVHPRSELVALPLPDREWAVGAKVRAFRWSTGYQPGVIKAVVEPMLRYTVALDEGGEAAYFFSSLLPSK